MKKALLLFSLASLMLASCYKDDVDISALRNNPFDADYNGPSVFRFDTTYEAYTTLQNGDVLHRQAMEFSVNSALFLRPTTYSVQAKIPPEGEATTLSPITAGGDRFVFYSIGIFHGQPLCLQLQLSNSSSIARPETVCGTLP